MSLARAIETGDVALLPSRRDEEWRWTDLRGLIRAAPPPSPEWDGPLAPGPFSGVEAEEVLIVNGRGPDRIAVGPGERRTVALRLIAAPNAGSHLSRLAITVGEGAELTLLESHEGAGEAYLTAGDLTIDLAPGARVERIVMGVESESGVAVSIAKVRAAPSARFEQTVLVSGARRERVETVVEHPGAGASVRLDGVYLLADRRHSDITTVVTHAGVDGVTDQLVKGVVDGQARGVFQGRIVVARGADQTDARMGHHALILSDRAEVDAKPELEIFADDVACAHGNTIGALDEEALFYAAQRGIPPDEARALLIQAYVGEVVDRIAHEGARDVARAWVAQRMGGSL
ncbi:MAG TPA: Fe-S cluster assembly protein SufD [Caulobacteraceae bacterium]|jgi:Fe-S cluster assembly protein SufD